MKINYALPAIEASAIEEFRKNELSQHLEEVYMKLYAEGNKFSFGDWHFYPLRDSKNFKKTAVDILEVNKKGKSDYVTIAHNTQDSYMGYSKLDGRIYCWSEWLEVEPQLMFNSFNDVLKLVERLPEVREQIKVEQRLAEDILSCQTLYYLNNPAIDYCAGNYSFLDFPHITYLFWDSKEAADEYRKGNWSTFQVESVTQETFRDVVLPELAFDERLFGFNWTEDYEIDISDEQIYSLIN